MTVRIVTADTVITLGNSVIRVPAGTLVDVEPGSALETAYGANLARPSRDIAQLATGSKLPELRRGLDGNFAPGNPQQRSGTTDTTAVRPEP